MQFIKKYGFLLLAMLFVLVGFILLKFSVDLGLHSASDYLSSIGGLDTTEFNNIQSKYILSNMITGGILFTSGIISLLFSVYTSLKNDK